MASADSAILPAFYSGYSSLDEDDLSATKPANSGPQQRDKQLTIGHAADSSEPQSEKKPEVPNWPPPDADKSALKRFQVAKWLRTMTGPSSISSEPCEEEFCLSLSDGVVLCTLLNKVNPAIMQKINHNFSPSDNVRKFLLAAADMKLSLFEVSDLEQGIHRPSSVERIVDCLLSLKSFYEWKQRKDLEPHNHEEDLALSSKIQDTSSAGEAVVASLGDLSRSNLDGSMQKSPYQPRKRWVLPENENFNEANMPMVANSFVQQKTSKSKAWNSLMADENFMPGSLQPGAGSPSNHAQHLGQKFREVLRLKTKETRQDLPDLGSSEVLTSLENFTSQSVSSLFNALLGEKQQQDIANLVDFMLKKVIEEFEQRLAAQNEQVAKLKKTLKEHLLRENKLASRARVLETLAAGTGEEVKIVSSQLKQLKMEKRQAEQDKVTKEMQNENLLRQTDDCKARIMSLVKELEQVKHIDQKRVDELECQKEDLEQKLQAQVSDLQAQLEESRTRVKELEESSLAEKESLKQKHQHYNGFVRALLGSFQDIKMALHCTRQEVLHLQHVQQEEAEALEMQISGIAQAATGYHRVLAENRQLYNEVQDLKGNIRVYCRVRPFLPGQASRHSSVEFVGESGDILISNPTKHGKDNHKIFNFNKVFKPSATQEEVFVDTRPLIRSVLDGYNVCIFAYGQTGSGKTYTMSGPNSLSEQDWGVNYRALNDLFHISQSRKDAFKYEVGVQMIEIYNEQVRDLLFVDAANRRLEIRNNSQLNGLNVPDACMLPVNSSLDVFELMKIGQKNRAVGATALNERSSRSHSVLTVHVQGTDLDSGSVIRGCLHLVDLAGSERVDKSEATGDRLKEAQHINKSLSALGDVVSALAQKNAHVPYRNSKLTQLLQDSLGGQAKTLMFVHVSPDVESYGETISTLKFAERVASVELGAARSNKESREVRDLKDQVALLKEIITKKDAETARLQSVKTFAVESTSSFERSKDKLTSSISSQKSMIEAHQLKLRRQTVDLASQKERQNIGRQFHDIPSQDSETVSPPASPTRLRRSHDRVEKKEILKAVNLAKANPNGASEISRINDTDANMNQSSIRVHHSAVEYEASSKDWQERLHSSSDSSLFGTASVDEMPFTWDSVYADKASESMMPSPQIRRGKDEVRQSYAMNLHKSASVDSDSLRIKPERSHDWIREKELDTSSGLSDGDISQPDTEASFSSTAEEVAASRKHNIVAGKNSQSQRKLSLSQQPGLPTRGDWKSLNSESTSTRVRRYSTAVSPSLGLEWSTSQHSKQKPPLLRAKQSLDGGTAAYSDAGAGLNSQCTTKQSKRRL